MKFNKTIEHTADLINLIAKSPKPPDKTASAYFRAKKYIGSKERRLISSLVFNALRNLLLIESISAKIHNKQKNSGLTACISLALGLGNFSGDTDIQGHLNNATPGASPEEIFKQLSGLLPEEFDYAKLQETIETEIKHLEQKNDWATLFSFPVGLLGKINLPDNKLKSFLSYSITPANVYIRIDGNKISVKEAVNYLAENGIDTEIRTAVPNCISLAKRAKIDSLPIYRDGLIEIQDAGSQIIGFALGPEPGTRILDACAGAGGKSLQLASLLNDRAEITSCDTEFRKVNELGKRAGRANFNSIKGIGIHTDVFGNERKFASLAGNNFDYILVDAPCSGTGTMRRDPTRKYRNTPRIIEKMHKIQLEILEFYSKFLRPGGILLYATCSVLPDENEMVAEKFLSNNPHFETEALLPAFKTHGIKLPIKPEEWHYTLYPDVIDSDGFFMAKFIKNS